MTNKILNWLAGGFFRKLGSILVYILIALIVGYFISNSDLKLPYRLPINKLLGIDTVSAATVSKSSDKWATQWCSDRTCDYTQAGSTYFRDYENVDSGAYTNSNHYYLTAIRLRQQFNSSNYLQSGTQYQFRYKLWFNPLYKLSDYYLHQYDVDFLVTDSSNNQIQVEQENFTCTFTKIENTNSFFFTCLYTPTSTLKQVYFRIKTNFTLYGSYSDFSGYIWKSMNTINYTSSSITYNTGTQDAIQSQTNIIVNNFNETNENINNVNESVNELNDTISDTDTSQSTTDASNFINGFSLSEMDNLTAIITLPLILINGIVNDNYDYLCTQYKGKNICLPSGLIVWNSNSTLLSDFKTFFNLVVGGFLSYKLLLSIVRCIRKMLDPVADSVQVMEL